ncbi:MAG TPA: ABC transporter permease [Burkholderiaceae bacterium]|nr:ABC transporter permease [Burkholderiaceae bacterium]
MNTATLSTKRFALPYLSSLPWTLVVGASIVAMSILVAIFAPFIAPYDPFEQVFTEVLQAPSMTHWFGTDNFGRDVFSRVLWGTRIDLLMGSVAVFIPFVIGTAIGTLAGYYGGWIDRILMRILDITMSFPFFVLVIAIVAILGAGLISFFIAVSMVGWVSYARLVRAQFLVIKKQDFVMAAKCLGFSDIRIMARHILPNAIMPAIVFCMSDVIIDLLLGSSLSYLGLGVSPPTAEWGLMIAESQNYLAQAWWMTVFPGLAIVLLALGFSLLADGLADKLSVTET